MSFDSVKDPDGDFWSTLQAASEGIVETQYDQSSVVPRTVKRKAIDLCNLLDRSREEQTLLKQEMKNTWGHFSDQHDLISEFIMATEDNERVMNVERGAELIARKKLFDIDVTLMRLYQKLSPYVEIEEPSYFRSIDTATALPNDIAPVDDDDEEEVVICEDIDGCSESGFSEHEYDSDDDREDDSSAQIYSHS